MLLLRRAPEALLIRHLLSISMTLILITLDYRRGEMTWAMVVGMQNTLGVRMRYIAAGEAPLGRLDKMR